MLDPNAQQHFNARLRRTNVVPGVSPMGPQAPAGTGGFNMQNMNTSTAPPRGMQGGRTHSPGLNRPPHQSPLGPSQGSPFMGGGSGIERPPEGGPFGGAGGPMPVPDIPRQRGFEDRPQGFEPMNTGVMPPPRQVDFQPRPYGGGYDGSGINPGAPLQSPANPAGLQTGGFNMQNGPVYNGGMDPGDQLDMWQKLKRPMMQKQEWDGWNL